MAIKLYDHNYGSFSSAVASHPFGMQFAITNAVPPTLGTVLMSMDTGTGVAVNTSLTVANNLSVGGEIDCPNIYTKTELDGLMTSKYPLVDTIQWQLLGTIFGQVGGQTTTIKINTNKAFNAVTDNILSCALDFTRSTSSTQAGLEGGSVHGACSFRGSRNLATNTIRIVQFAIGEWHVWVKLANSPGLGYFTALSTSQFIYAGTGALSSTAPEPGYPYINPTRLFSYNVDGLQAAGIQATGSILSLKGGSLGCQTFDSSNNLLLDVNSAGVSSLRNLSVLVNSTNATTSVTNTSGSGAASHYLTAATVTGQLFVGGGAMVVATNTVHPMRFATNRFVNATSLTIEANGSVVCNSSMCSSSDSKLKDNQQPALLADLQAIFDAVEVKTYERNDLGGQKRVGFIAQEIEAALPEYYQHIVGEGTLQRGEDLEPETIKTVDYARLSTVLWGVCKNLERRVQALESLRN